MPNNLSDFSKKLHSEDGAFLLTNFKDFIIFLESLSFEYKIESNKVFFPLQKRTFDFVGNITLASDSNFSNVIRSHFWVSHRPFLEARIRTILGLNTKIHARKTKIIRIESKVAIDFLNQSHILGARKSKFKFGAFYKDELVAVMTFAGKRSQNDVSSVEMIQFANKIGLTIVGGLDKMIKVAFENLLVDQIITYLDKEWGSAENWLKLGFELVGETNPIEFMVNQKSQERFLALKDESFDNFDFYKNAGNYKIRILKNQKVGHSQ